MIPKDLASFKREAREFCTDRTGGDEGVRVRDERYRMTTERRDPGPGYSSCGDLGHALVEHLLGDLAKRVPWINRASLGQYRPGMNVGRLTRRPIGGGASGLARAPLLGEQFQTGDIIVMWSRPDTLDAHVCVVDTHGPELLATWDYGQGAMRREAWALKPDQIEGCRRVRKLRPPIGGACIVEDGRRVQSVLPIEALHRFALHLETTP